MACWNSPPKTRIRSLADARSVRGSLAAFAPCLWWLSSYLAPVLPSTGRGGAINSHLQFAPVLV
jgi:hypothetical protein